MEGQHFNNLELNEQTDEKLETGKKVFDFLERTKFVELRHSDEAFADWLKNISFEDFIDYITRLNGILREKSIKDRSVDGSGVEVSFGIDGGDTSYLPPSADSKETMMKEIFETIQELAENKDRALLAYYAIQTIHPYLDGNGRTGRLIYELVSEDGKDISEEKLSKLLDHDKKGNAGTGEGRDTFAEKVLEPNKAYYFVNREIAKDMFGEDFIKEYGKIYYSGNLGRGNVPENLNITPQERELVQKIMGEGDVNNFPFRGLVIAKLLMENGKLKDCQYEIKPVLTEKNVISEDVGKKMFAIDNDLFEESLTAEDVSRLIEIHKEIKEKFIKTLEDIFSHPENHQIRKIDGSEVAIKDLFS